MIAAPVARDRVAERDRAAVGVDLLLVETEVVDHRQRLGGERLVELDHLDLVEPGARLRSSTLRTAGTGPMPMIDGSTPQLAYARIRARTGAPSSAARARCSSARPRRRRRSSREALPAVTVPSGLNTGLSSAIDLGRRVLADVLVALEGDRLTLDA